MKFEMSEADIDRLLRAVFDGDIDSSSKLPEWYYDRLSSYLEHGLFKGFGDNIDDLEIGTTRSALLQDLRENVYMFSGAKTYQQVRDYESTLRDLSSKMADAATYRDFKNSVMATYDNYNTNWLASEYNTAVGQAQQASQWDEIQNTKATFPYLKYSAVMDPNTSEICAPLDGMTLPVDDKMWDKYTPLNHFNCRCILVQIDKYDDVKLTTDAEKKKLAQQVGDQMQDVFKMNPGKDGYIFKPDHPYFEVAPKDRKFARENFGLPLPKDKEYENVEISYQNDHDPSVSPPNAKELMRIAGVPHDIKGKADIEYYKSNAEVRFKGEGVIMTRVIRYEEKTIDNEYFRIAQDSAYKGKGAQIFKSQVDHATRAGYKEIKTAAAGSAKESKTFNGYYTWARLGYVPTKDKQYGKSISEAIGNFNDEHGTNAKIFEELMGTKTGQEFWKNKGFPFNGKFDLQKNSYSQTTLQNYIDGKGKK
jgi:SPP1 gp7 family putative phage head morphogenesis protein